MYLPSLTCCNAFPLLHEKTGNWKTLSSHCHRPSSHKTSVTIYKWNHLLSKVIHFFIFHFNCLYFTCVNLASIWPSNLIYTAPSTALKTFHFFVSPMPTPITYLDHYTNLITRHLQSIYSFQSIYGVQLKWSLRNANWSVPSSLNQSDSKWFKDFKLYSA